MKHVGKNIKEMLHDVELGKDLLNKTSKIQEIQIKIDKGITSNGKAFPQQREESIEYKDSLHRKHIFKIHISLLLISFCMVLSLPVLWF